MRKGHRTASATMAVMVVAGLPVAACESPVPFYPPGQGSPDDPVVGLGGHAPYLQSPSPHRRSAPDSATSETTAREGAAAGAAGMASAGAGLPVTGGVYTATRPGLIDPAVRRLPARLYVPNGRDGTVDVVDLRTLKVTARLHVGGVPRRIVTSWDLRRLWVTDARGGTVVPVSPRTGRRGRSVRLGDRGGRLYFTPDGSEALVLAGRQRQIDVRDPHTMRPRGRMALPCAGAEHADFSATGTFMVASCTPSGRMVRVDPALREVTGTLALPRGSAPGSVRLAPDGRTFYVADHARAGVWTIDSIAFTVTGFVPTRPGAYGLTFSRDSRRLFVLGTGTLSVVDLAAGRATSHWRLPGGGSPEPGGVSADGTELWLCEPRTGMTYALSTQTGRLVRTLRVGGVPQGMVVHPQPGRHSLGGTSIFR
ncbi:YncE family protein [Spirillospora sp. NPDC048911]|uniref:YncE family protein n=1 Tax=Spirillospora sp. NPDC048911 TaxID=3364527 RepID=UPI00370FD44B